MCSSFVHAPRISSWNRECCGSSLWKALDGQVGSGADAGRIRPRRPRQATQHSMRAPPDPRLEALSSRPPITRTGHAVDHRSALMPRQAQPADRPSQTCVSGAERIRADKSPDRHEFQKPCASPFSTFPNALSSLLHTRTCAPPAIRERARPNCDVHHRVAPRQQKAAVTSPAEPAGRWH
jgi:hypothetical protein